MKVPYSMDESEPDLYGGMGGHRFDDDHFETQTKWDCEDRSYSNVKLEEVECVKFYTQEEMTKVIQHNIKTINNLRLEIDQAYDKGYAEGYKDGLEI